MRFEGIWDKYGIFMMTLVIFGIFAIFSPSILLTSNIYNILTNASLIAIAAAGMTFAITAGGFDLSIGSTATLTSCILAMMIPLYGLWGGIGISVIVGILLGVINGMIVTKFKIQTFIATLATMIIFRGIALMYTEGKDIPLFASPEIKVLTTGEVLGIPFPIILMFLVYVISFMLYKHTIFGVHVRSIGSNESAARMSGIKVDRVMMWVFIITALTSVVSGSLITSQLLIGSGKLAEGFELDVITAVVLGGTALSGGKGNIWGTLVAAIMLSIIQNGLNLMGVTEFYQKLAIGIILVLALSISGLREVLKEKSQLVQI